jgi:hypothetical protein
LPIFIEMSLYDSTYLEFQLSTILKEYDNSLKDTLDTYFDYLSKLRCFHSLVYFKYKIGSIQKYSHSLIEKIIHDIELFVCFDEYTQYFLLISISSLTKTNFKEVDQHFINFGESLLNSLRIYLKNHNRKKEWNEFDF